MTTPAYEHSTRIPTGSGHVPTYKMTRQGNYVTNERGEYIPESTSHPWAIYYGYLSMPLLAGTNVSCGVRQMYGLHSSPPLLSILSVLCQLQEGGRFSQVIFSDTEDVLGQTLNDASKKLYTPEELRLLEAGNRPGAIHNILIKQARGALGSCIASHSTLNRNTSNHIRSFVWTLPYGDKYSKKFSVSAAIRYVNEYRAKYNLEA